MTVRAAPVPLPDPPLCEGDVALRPWGALDAPDLTAAWADAEIASWTGVPARTDETAARRWIAGEADRRSRGLALDLVIETDGEVVGEIGLAEMDAARRTAEIGWWIAPRRRLQGLAGRSARLVTRWALSELDLDAIVARCHPGNPGSAGVARRAGFTPAGRVGDVELWRCTSSDERSSLVHRC